VRARLPDQQAGSAILWLAAAAAVLAVQQAAVRVVGTDGGPALMRRAIILVTTVALVAMALHFRRFAGAWLVAAGITLNALPILAHGGLMPVAYETVLASELAPGIDEHAIGQPHEGSKDIVLERDDIRLPWLADRHIVAIPGYGANIYSIGDFVLFAGVAVAMGETLAMLSIPAGSRRRAAAGTI
jgi:hypothetical protein